MREGMGNPGQSFPRPYGYLHGKENPLQVSLPTWSKNRSKNEWRLERYKSGWMQINCYTQVKKENEDIIKKNMIGLQMTSFTYNKQN